MWSRRSYSTGVGQFTAGVCLLLLAFSGASAQEWLTTGAWAHARFNGHNILRTDGPGTVTLAPASQPPNDFTPNSKRFGFLIHSGRLDFLFRIQNEGHLRIRFDYSSGQYAQLTVQKITASAKPQYADIQIPSFEPDKWYNFRLTETIISEPGSPNLLKITGSVDGRPLFTSYVDDPFASGGVEFTSDSMTSAALDLFDDPLDEASARARTLELLEGYPEPLANNFITTNRDTFFQPYSSLGRPSTFVEFRDYLLLRHVINDSELLEDEYVVPTILSSSSLLLLSQPGFPIQPGSSIQPGALSTHDVRRPIIYSVSNWKLNVLNDPTDSVFTIYGTNLGDDLVTLYLLSPSHENGLRRTLPIKKLTGSTALNVPGNIDGIDMIDSVTADLRDFAPNQEYKRHSV